MKPPPSSSLEPLRLYTRSRRVVIADDCSSGPIGTKTIDSLMRLLQEIRNLQKTRLHYEEEQRNEADRENEINNDWMLAAAVVDRICAIIFTIVFIGGNLFFLILFFVIARP